MTVDRVVIIGASAAGLFAAAAAAGEGRKVIMVERDRLDESEAQARPGVPQGRQPHVFLYRGLLAAEELLPGLRADLLGAGAIPVDTAALAWLGPNGWTARNSPSYQVFSTTRPLLEATIRRRVLALPGVEIRSARTVVDIRPTEPGPVPPDNGGWTVDLDDGTTVVGDLVVDASGRNSRLPHWLADHASGNIRTTEIDAKIGYATRMYRGSPDLGDVPGVVIASTPDEPVGGLALPVEDGRWLIGAVGFGNRRPTRDAAEFDEFLFGLRDPALWQLAQRMEPISEVFLHRQTGNRRRHYEEQRDWPDGLLVVGDAFCAFNPVYGQGIAVAACEAVLLRKALRSELTPGSCRRLLREFAEVTELPWSIATGQDLRYSSSEQQPTRLGTLSNRWASELDRLSVHGNVRAADTLGGVYHLMAAPRLLFHPALIRASIRGRLLGYGRPAQRPTGLPALEERRPPR